MPLRQHLSQWLLKELLNRATKVSESQPGQELYQTCLSRKLILEDMSWPYHRWDAQQQALVIDKKKSVTMPKMLQHLTELIEDFRDPTLVVRFQGLSTSTMQKTVPWKLQLNLRSNRPYELLLALTHSSLWGLVGTSLKPHSTQLSSLAQTIQNMLPNQKPAGKGTGKNKGKSKAHAGS